MGSKAEAADDLRYPPWSGVGEPGPHSLRLSQLTTVLKEKNPEVWGFYREFVTSIDQERQSLQSQLESPDITYNQKRTIDQRILTIDSMVPAEISDDDITTTILTHPTPQYNLTHLSNKLIETVPAEDPEHPILRSFGESFDRLVEDLPDFLVGAAHTFYMSPKDRPGQRRKYDLILRANVGRAEKLRSLLETKPESILAGRWEKELGRVNEFIDTHPEWKDKEPYPEEALTPQQLHWKEASDKIIDEARDDLENVHLVSADKLAYYKWQKEGQLIDWTDPKKWTAPAFQHAIGSGLASFVPSAAIGLATGFLTKNPSAGLTVGRIAMGIMEGSDEYRQALDYALENGLDMEEARHLATYTGTAYGIGSAWMEGWVPGMWMRRLGMMTGKGYSTMFGKALFGNMSRKSVGKYAGAKRMFGKAVDKIPYFVQSGATEGFQELSQYLYQVSIQAGYKDVGETYVDRYMNVYDVGEAATSAYAGTVFGGTLGIPVGIAARLTKKEKEAVEAAEKVEEEVTRVVPLEEVVPEEVVADPLLDYVNRLSDIDRVQLSPEEEPVEGSSKLDISVYKHQYDKSSSDKLLGLIEDVGKDVISAVESLSPENKTDLLDRLMVQVNRENPGVDIKTEEEAMNFLNAFSESGAIVSVKEKVPLGEKAKVITKTKFDPAKMSERAQQNIIKMGFDPKKSFITPPKIKPEAPPPKVPPVPKLTREGKAQMGKLGYTPIDVTKMTSERIGQILEKQIAKPPVPKIVPPTEPPIKPPVPKPRPPEPGPPKPRPPTPAPPPSPKKPSVKNQEIIDEIARLNAETSELDIGYDDIRQINWNSLTPNVQNNPKAQKLAQEFSDLNQKIQNMSPAELAELPESIRNEFIDYPAIWGYSRAQKGVSVHNIKNMLEMYEYTLRTKGKERAEEYFNSREINEKTPKEVVAKWRKGVEEINRVVEKEEAAAAIAKEAPLAPPVEAPGEVKEEAPAEVIEKAEVKIVEGTPNTKRAARRGEGIYVMRPNKGDKIPLVDEVNNFGNPWSAKGYQGTIKAKDIPTSVANYRAWLRGEAHQNIEPTRRQWILDQVDKGVLDNQKLLYFKSGYRSHADELQDFVNERKEAPAEGGLVTLYRGVGGKSKDKYIQEGSYVGSGDVVTGFGERLSTTTDIDEAKHYGKEILTFEVPQSYIDKHGKLNKTHYYVDGKRVEGAEVSFPKGLPAKFAKEAPDEKVEGLQSKMTSKIERIASPTAKKWVPKEQVKTKIATQFIGEGANNSSTDRYRRMYAGEGVSNTGNYTSDDIIYVSSNGKRRGRINPVKDGILQGEYKNIDKAMEAGATIVMDTAEHLSKTKSYNIGEMALAKYLADNGYAREGVSGTWKPKEAPVEKPSLAFQDVIVSKKQDRIVGAQTDLKNNRIIVSKKVLQKKYKEKAWTKPKVKGVDPLPKDTFKTYEEWENFVIAHERAHFTKENRAIKNLAERENDANRIALEKVGAVPPVEEPSVVKAPPLGLKYKTPEGVLKWMPEALGLKIDTAHANVVRKKDLKVVRRSEFINYLRRVQDVIDEAEKPGTIEDYEGVDISDILPSGSIKKSKVFMARAMKEFDKDNLPDAFAYAESAIQSLHPVGYDPGSMSEFKLEPLAEAPAEVAGKAAPAVAPPVKKFVYGEKVEKSLPMNFVYGEGTALPSRPDVKSKTTFDAILAGERRATSRKDGSLDKLGIGSIVEFYAKGRKEIIKAVVTQKWVPAKIIGPERWSELEGYDEDDVKKNWTSGKKLSEYTQIEFEVLETALAPAIAPKKPRLHVIGKDYVDKTPIADKETIQKSLIDIMGKHAPDVQDTFVKEIEESPEAVGRYIDGMVQFILGKATETTAVHEPIHWFVERVLSQKDYDFLHDKFLTNEAMVEAATDSYMKKKTFRGKVKSLFRKMWNAIKKFLGIKLTSDETVTEMFDRIGVEFDIRRPAVGKPRLYKPKKEPTSEPIEGDESEGKREDGVDFSREVKPEEVSETDEGYVEAPDEQDEIIGSLYTNDYRSASLANYQSYFQDVFNRHISKASHAKMVEIAKRNKEVGFTQFFAEVREWAVNLLDENGVGVDINKTYSREQRAYMKQFFNKSNSRIALFDSSTEESIKRTAGGRIYMDLFITRGERGDIESFLFNYSLTEQLSTNPDGNKKRPSYYISNFTEDRNGPRTMHIRMDHIQEVMYNEKYDEERARVAKEKGVVYNVPREFLFPSNIRITGDIIRQWDTIFADDFTNKGDPNLMFVAGSKGGNDSVIFLGIVSKEHRNMNAAGFSAYLQSEVDRGLVTPDQRLEAISVADDHFGTNNQIYGQIAGKHEWWKGVTGSNYLLRLRKGKPVNIREHFNRLRGPFSEGTNPLGIKDSRMMLIDSKEVKMKVNGKNVDLFPHAGVYAFDGHFMSSGEWFRDLENNIGYLGDLYEAKTYINDLSENLVDYLSLKMMQMPPIAPGVQFIKDGKVIAEVKLDSRTGRTYFVTPEGERFEHIGSDEEAKMIAGKYDRDVENGGLTEEDGFYKLHTLTSKNFKVLFVAPEQSKTDVAYPVAEAELALDKNFIGSEKFDMFISSVKTYYETVGNSWLDDLYDFHVDAEKLRDELYRDLNTGQLPTDLQRWISMIGENGEGIHIPHITKLISSYLNNKMINNGMYKVREKGMGTSLFVKPKAHLNIEQGEVSVSARNTTYYDIVKDKYESEGMAFISMMATLDREGAVQAMMEFDAKPLEDRIDELNRWLEANKDRNPLWVKIHRQPVTGPSVVLMRKMSQLVLGEHGEAIFMTDQDLATLQSDSDGDMAGVTHFKDKDLTNVLVAWHESTELRSRKKIVYTQAFLTDKKQTSMINYKHFIEAATGTTVASGSQGIVTNSKTIGNLLAFKELKVKIRNPNRNKKGWTIEARQPSEEVIMGYARLDKEALMENDGELYNLLIKQEDKIVSATGKEIALDELAEQKSLYLKTTHEHQMSTLQQFAVDDTKLGMLAKIGYNFKFVTDLMWRNTDGSRIKNITGVRHVLSELRRIFNYSPMRRGIGSEGRLTMAENIIDSKALDNFLNMSKSKQSADLVYRINNAKKLANKWYYKGFHVESVSIETGRETPVESLLRLLAKKNHDMVNRPTPSDDNMLYTRDWSGTIGVFTEGSMATAHVMAMKELEQNWDNTVVEKGVTKNDMAKGVKFIKKVDPEFRDIFKDMKSTRAGKFIQPKPEYNDMLHDLVDKHIEEFNSLSENAQIYATLYFLSGTATRTADGKPALRVNILRLLPLDLMHEGTALKYAQTWWKMMNKPSHSVYKEGKDFRNETYKGFKFGAALELARKKNEESCG